MKMNVLTYEEAAVQPAHPLFPINQAFLWLPGLSGEEAAFCSYNEMRGDPGSGIDRRLNRKPAFDDREAYYAPPYPVSRETFIAWHTDHSPPFPYHPLPISRTLTAAEMADLASQVISLLGQEPEKHPSPLRVLNNDHKCSVLVALLRMELLDRFMASPGERRI